MQERAAATVLVLAAVLAATPALLPGGEAWMDNPARLLEAWSLAHGPLRATGWSPVAAGGFPVGVSGAPLGPLAISAGGWMGLPVVALWMAAIPLANAVFSLGVLQIARRALRDPAAALVAAGIAASAAVDLWGQDGAATGAWPGRLALGGLAAGIGSARLFSRPERVGAWLATLLLLDLRAGAVAGVWIGIAGLGRRRDRVLGAAIGVAIAAAGWAPRFSAGLHLSPAEWTPAWTLATLFAPIDIGALGRGMPLAVLGGPLGVLSALPLAGGLAVFAWRRPPPAAWVRDGRLLRRLALLGLGLALVSGVGLPLFGFAVGLAPWSLLPVVRLLLALPAAAGWISLGLRRPVLAIGAPALALGMGVGLAALPLRLSAGDAAVWDALHQSWADLAAAAPAGRIYGDDPAWDPDGPPLLRRAPVGALAPLWTGLPEVSGAADQWLKLPRAEAEAHPDDVQDALRLYGIGGVLTSAPWAAAIMAAVPQARRLSEHPPFSTWLLTADVPAELAIPADRGRVERIEQSWEAISGTLAAAGTGPVPFRVRRSWDPGWEAQFDGAPLPISADRETGFITGVAPGSGRLSLVWCAPGAWGRSVSAAGLSLALLAWAWGTRPKPQKIV